MNRTPSTETDFSEVKLPSDDLTMGMLRRTHKKLFVDQNTTTQCFDLLRHTIAAERRIVHREMLGGSNGSPKNYATNCDQHNDVVLLSSYYNQTGLAQGSNEAKELVRRLQQTAVQLASTQIAI